MLMLDVYDKPFNYLLQVENEYNEIVEKYKIRNEYYFNALRELRNKYNIQYDALTAKANILTYGNPEGKIDRKNRDRSDLYIKVLKYSAHHPKKTREEKRWLKKYFRSIKDIIRAKNCLEILVEKEETIEKFINASNLYLKTLDTISKMRKDVENAMYKTDVPDVVNTLNNILKQWKTYYGGNKI